MANGEIYRSIPAKLTAVELTDLLQSNPKFGYVSIAREGECAQYSYKLTWLSKGRQPLISIINSTGIIPAGSSVNVSLIQEGDDGNKFFPIPNDIIRTYHKTTQVCIHVYNLK